MASVDPPRSGDPKIAGLADRTTALVGWTIAWRATSAIATLALGALLIRELPAEEYGRYTFVLSVLVYIALLATFGQDLGGVLVAGAVGQSCLAAFDLLILVRRVRRAEGVPGDRVGWRRLLVYASGWLPSLLIASAVGLQFENIFLLRFSGSATVAYYDTGCSIPQRLVSLIPSLLTGAWVGGTPEGWRRESDRIRTSVAAFYKGIFLVAFPLAFAGGALLGPVIRLYTNGRYPPSERIAPLMLLFFIAALLATPWGLVVRVRELAWLNALITIAQLGFAAVADFWLIQSYGLGGAVVAVGLTTALTLGLTFAAWWAFDRATMNIPWRYAGRCMLAASPYVLLLPLAFTRLPARLLVLAAVAASALTTVAWGY